MNGIKHKSTTQTICFNIQLLTKVSSPDIQCISSKVIKLKEIDFCPILWCYCISFINCNS